MPFFRLFFSRQKRSVLNFTEKLSWNETRSLIRSPDSYNFGLSRNMNLDYKFTNNLSTKYAWAGQSKLNDYRGYAWVALKNLDPGLVTNITETPKYRFVGVDTGFNHLVRPTMYGSYHEIVNASNFNSEKKDVVVVGNICESGDILSRSGDEIERSISSPEVGQCIAFLDTGAYGYSMSSQYNLRPRPAEILVNNGQSRLIRKAESFEDITNCCAELI